MTTRRGLFGLALGAVAALKGCSEPTPAMAAPRPISPIDYRDIPWDTKLVSYRPTYRIVTPLDIRHLNCRCVAAYDLIADVGPIYVGEWEVARNG